MEILKLLSANEMLAQLISFFIVFFLLKKLAWKPLLKMLDDRRIRISSELKNIEDTKLQVANMRKEYEDKLAAMEETFKERMKQVVVEEKKISEEMRKKAYQETQDIITDARAHIKYELSKAKQELKERVVDLTIIATENIIKEKLTEDTDRRLVRDFLDHIDDINEK